MGALKDFLTEAFSKGFKTMNKEINDDAVRTGLVEPEDNSDLELQDGRLRENARFHTVLGPDHSKGMR